MRWEKWSGILCLVLFFGMASCTGPGERDIDSSDFRKYFIHCTESGNNHFQTPDIVYPDGPYGGNHIQGNYIQNY